MLFISLQRCIHILPRSCIDEGRVGPLPEVTSYILKILDGVKDWIVVTMCKNCLPALGMSKRPTAACGPVFIGPQQILKI